jgi:hypothetical protein
MISVIVGAVLVVALGAAGALWAFTPSGIAVTGTLELSHRDGLGGFCAQAMTGFDDIHGGAQVVITDGDGKTLAVGRLADGRRVAPTVCAYDFAVDGVPDGEDFYGVEVSHRGKVQYPRADLDKPLRLSVGG